MGKSAVVDATKTTARPTGHMNYTQAPAACQKNFFHLFHFHSASEKLLFLHTAGSHIKLTATMSQA